jgi:hypothetical protein
MSGSPVLLNGMAMGMHLHTVKVTGRRSQRTLWRIRERCEPVCLAILERCVGVAKSQ